MTARALPEHWWTIRLDGEVLTWERLRAVLGDRDPRCHRPRVPLEFDTASGLPTAAARVLMDWLEEIGFKNHATVEPEE